MRRVERLVELPIWAFHSRIDRFAPIEHLRNAVSQLSDVGGNAYLTEVNGGADYGHDCRTKAFLDFPLKDWLLAQERGVESPRILAGEWRLRLKVVGEEIMAPGNQYYFPVPLGMATCWLAAKRQFRHRMKLIQESENGPP